jgi:hypothetical protein
MVDMENKQQTEPVQPQGKGDKMNLIKVMKKLERLIKKHPNARPYVNEASNPHFNAELQDRLMREAGFTQ